jgi:hypothetical protein
MNLLLIVLFIKSHEGLPPVFPQALTGGWTPFHAGRGFIAVDILATPLAAKACLIRKDLDECSTTGALINSRAEVRAVLTGAFSWHWPPLITKRSI